MLRTGESMVLLLKVDVTFGDLPLFSPKNPYLDTSACALASGCCCGANVRTIRNVIREVICGSVVRSWIQ
jgi:hypothetical protein